MKKKIIKALEATIWLVYILCILISRNLFAKDVSIRTIVVLVISLCIMLWFSLYIHRNEGLGIKYNYTLGIIVSINFINLLVILIFKKFYVTFFQRYNAVLATLSLLIFYALVAVAVLGKKKMEVKNKSR